MFFIIIVSLFFHEGYAQKVEERSFDKFDSVYTITTQDETLVGKFSAKKFLYTHTTFHWFKKAKFINLPTAKTFELLIGFKTDIPTAIDATTQIKVEFADGTIGVYTNPNSKYQIVTDMGFYIFHVATGDKLFNSDVKTIQIATSDTHIDYEIPAKKASYIKDALLFTFKESEKVL